MFFSGVFVCFVCLLVLGFLEERVGLSGFLGEKMFILCVCVSGGWWMVGLVGFGGCHVRNELTHKGHSKNYSNPSRKTRGLKGLQF